MQNVLKIRVQQVGSAQISIFNRKFPCDSSNPTPEYPKLLRNFGRFHISDVEFGVKATFKTKYL
eukprot:scaffold7439_cov168-Ochromonas_danica.AAC.2